MRCRATLARLGRINALQAASHDYTADWGDDEMFLDRDALKSLQRMLVRTLGRYELPQPLLPAIPLTL